MPEKTCADCIHFIQHYRKDKRSYYPIACGHCTALYVKKRQPEDKLCSHFQQKPSVN